MRIDDLFLVEDQYLEEGPIWDKTRQVGAAVGKGIGAVGQGIGAVAGVPAGIARSIKKGYNRAADTIAGGPDEAPAQQQGGAQTTQASAPAQQGGGSGFAQAMQQASGGGGASGDAAGLSKQLRQKAEQLIKAAEELEKQAQAQMSAQQASEPTQQAQPTAQAEPQATTTQAQADTTQQAQPNPAQSTAQAEPQATTTTQAQPNPADNVSTTSSTGGQTSQTSTGQIHKANPDNPNFKQAGAQDVTPKPDPSQPPQLTMVQGGKGTAKDPKVQADIAARKAALAQSKADRLAGKGFQAGQKYAAEGVEFYSKFFKKMI
jgi:hypothetical protein